MQIPKFDPPNFKEQALNRSFDQVQASLNPLLKRVQAGTKVSGSTGGNAALKSLIKALASAGIITDETS